MKRPTRKQWENLKPEQKLGDAPVQDEYIIQMNAVAAALDDVFNGEDATKPKQTGFVLMVFPYGDVDGRCNYISNGADRRDVVTLMKEMIARFEGQPEMKGTA
jgi:hypothetical protein